MYAIIATGGKQYRVSEGDVIHIEKLENEVDDEVTFPVLLLGGKELKVGKPYVEGASVVGKVLKQVKGEKIIVFKFKSKKNYRRKAGHRQLYTRVQITAIKEA
ncbi:MAG: 50S ribosomal protein L21 [Christensenellaceae bacterium]|nr:50S ribosomal protein L21 [Christensenellaceae bacterium]